MLCSSNNRTITAPDDSAIDTPFFRISEDAEILTILGLASPFVFCGGGGGGGGGGSGGGRQIITINLQRSRFPPLAMAAKYHLGHMCKDFVTTHCGGGDPVNSDLNQQITRRLSGRNL
jgi:hypothetical protein